MTPRQWSRLALVARYGAAAVAIGYTLLYVVVALWRLPHPFELNWMEGAMVDHVRRIAAGERIYVEPSLEFVPFIYPAAFYYASAGVAEITGVGFVALRLVSFLSSLGVFALLYLFVAYETKDRTIAITSVGLFAATYHIGGAYLDVGRVDSLFLFILLSAFFVLRSGESIAAHIAGGLLIALAFLTKQSAIVMAAPVVLVVIRRAPRLGLVTGGVALTAMLAATIAIDAAHDGWYRFYAFELPSGYPMLTQRLVDFWRIDLRPLALAWAVGLLYLVAPGRIGARSFYGAMAAGMLVGAWFSRANPGGNDNVLIPAFVIASVVFGLGLHAARGSLATLEAGTRARGELWMGLVCVLQFAVLAYNPLHRIPDHDDVEAGRNLVHVIASTDGEVWVPYHGFIPSMAGKRSFAHWMAVSDVLESGRRPLRASLQQEIETALRTRRFSLIVQSTAPFGNSPEFDQFYALRGEAVLDEDALWPVTGARRRAESLYAPK